MKIIALLTFKNEEWVLREYLRSIAKVVDHIIAYDDRSTDGSRKILEEAGATIIEKDYKTKSYFAEHTIRQELLIEGRKAMGTHFVCLDADEVFSNTFIKYGREKILSLQPKQSLWMDWVNLYGDMGTERIDGVYKQISKSFIFCDHIELAFPYAFVGVSRTPTLSSDKVILNRSEGSVIHFQFLNTERSMTKRAWYMCSEIIEGSRSAMRINATYDIQKSRVNIKKRPLDEESAFETESDSLMDYDPKSDWRFEEMLGWFDTYGIGIFEQLDIWESKAYAEEFKRRTGRVPKPNIIPAWILALNDMKNRIKNSFRNQ